MKVMIHRAQAPSVVSHSVRLQLSVLYISMHPYEYMCMYAWVSVCMCVCICVYVDMGMCVHICIFIYTYLRMCICPCQVAVQRTRWCVSAHVLHVSMCSLTLSFSLSCLLSHSLALAVPAVSSQSPSLCLSHTHQPSWTFWDWARQRGLQQPWGRQLPSLRRAPVRPSSS